jgi:hypothetical protein
MSDKVTVKIKTPNRILTLNNKPVRTPANHIIAINKLDDFIKKLKSEFIEYEICEWVPKNLPKTISVNDYKKEKETESKIFRSKTLNDLLGDETF